MENGKQVDSEKTDSGNKLKWIQLLIVVLILTILIIQFFT